MADDVQPFPIPGQHAGPDLEAFVRLDLAPEDGTHGAQYELEGPVADAFRLPRFHHAALQETREQVRPRDVEVREERAVGLVRVDIALQKRCVRRDDDWLEERARSDVSWGYPRARRAARGAEMRVDSIYESELSIFV